MREYRLEITKTKTGKTKHYLVKDIKFKGIKRKIKKYLGNEKPSPAEITEQSNKHRYDIEKRAVLKKTELSTQYYNRKFLTDKHLETLEKTRWLHQAVSKYLTPSETEAIEQSQIVQYVQGTTAIEDNTLTHQEVHDLLVRGILPTGRSLREINEVQNYIPVKKYTESYHGRVTKQFIKKLHQLIMANIDHQSAGTFRRIDNIGIYRVGIQLTPAILIDQEIDILIKEYDQNIKDGYHPFECAAMFHHGFETIHPFTDGNGRVGREVFNYMLSRSGYPKLILKREDRENYLKALRSGNREEYNQMNEIFVELYTHPLLTPLQKTLEQVT